MKTCPICSCLAEKQQSTNLVTFNGVTKEIPLWFYVCSFCGSVTGDSEILKQNKEEMVKFKNDQLTK